MVATLPPAITALNGSDSKGEGPITQHVVAPAAFSVLCAQLCYWFSETETSSTGCLSQAISDARFGSARSKPPVARSGSVLCKNGELWEPSGCVQRMHKYEEEEEGIQTL